MSPLLAQAVETAGAASGSAEFWIFWLLAPISLGAALAMVVLRNPVHAALMLVVNFFTIAVFYAVLEAQFLATVQIIVYAGAIMILFLFVLMLLGVDRQSEEGPGKLRAQPLVATIVGLGLLAALTVAVGGPYLGSDSACNAHPRVAQVVEEQGADARPCAGLALQNSQEGGNPRQIGALLFTRYLWPFEATSVLLVIAAIGAMVLGRREESLRDLVDVGSADPPRAPDRALPGRTPREVEERAVPLRQGPVPAAQGPPVLGDDDAAADLGDATEEDA